MKISRLVLKTAFNTLIFSAIALFFVVGLASFIVPAATADVFDGMHVKGFAMPLSKVSYQRNGDIASLDLLVARAVKYADYDTAAEYIPMLMDSPEYQSFADFIDAKGTAGADGYAVGIEGNYIIALFETGKTAECLERVSQALLRPYAGSGVPLNPARYLVRHLTERQTACEGFPQLLAARLDTAESSEKQTLRADLYAVYKAAGNEPQAAYWKAEYEANA